MQTLKHIGPALVAAMLFLGLFLLHVGPIECDTGLPACDGVPGILLILLNTLEARS